jgi:hypothetical protein
MIAILLGMVLPVCSALTGCQAATGADAPAASGHAGTTPTVGQVPLAVPVELREVLGTSPCTPQTPGPTTTSATSSTAKAGSALVQPVSAAPTILRDVDGVDCYQVSPPMMELQQLDSINVVNQPPATQWVITMTMTSSDAKTFAVLTTQHDREQLAFVVRGTVLSTENLLSPVTNGVVQLGGDFTQDDANRLVRQITG